MCKIVKKEDNGNALISFSDKEKLLIRKQFFPPSATIEDMQYCMGVAEQLGLNPILKQVYFVARKSNIAEYGQPANWVEKIEPLAGRDAFLTLAHRTGKFAGLECITEIKGKPSLKDGSWTIENDLVAIAKVFRTDTDKPFEVEVSYKEYVQKTKQGAVTKFWNEKPETMLKKVAESQALKKAFNVSGLYDESELGRGVTDMNKQSKPIESVDSSKLDDIAVIANVITGEVHDSMTADSDMQDDMIPEIGVEYTN